MKQHKCKTANADGLTDCLADRGTGTGELRPLFQLPLLRYFPGHTRALPEAGKSKTDAG